MLISKSFLVLGETIHRDGEARKNICDKVDAVINKFYDEHEDAKLVSLETNIQMQANVGTDIAFITITIEVEKKAEESKVKKQK